MSIIHMHTCAKLLGGFLLPLWKGAGSDPYKFLCTFSSNQTTAWKEMPVGVLVGNAWWVVGGQPQIGEGDSP